MFDEKQKDCCKGHIEIFFRKVKDDVYNHYDPHGEGAVPQKLGGFFIKTEGDESSSHGDASHRPDDRED